MAVEAVDLASKTAGRAVIPSDPDSDDSESEVDSANISAGGDSTDDNDIPSAPAKKAKKPTRRCTIVDKVSMFFIEISGHSF
jgi:hypothetical protein